MDVNSSDVVRNLGTVTAYKYALLHGYSGTEEQFGEDLANVRDYATAASQAATSASASAGAANQNLVNMQSIQTTVEGYKNAAAQSVLDASGHAASALEYKSAAASSATTANSAKNAAQTAATNAAASVASLFEVFSTSESYSVGDYVFYQNHLYKFTSAHTGAWNDEDAVEAELGGELEDLQGQLNAFESVTLEDLHGVSYESQTLTENQKSQARTNIGLGSITQDVADRVSYVASQNLTTEQKTIAQNNIGLGDINSLVTGTVKYSEAQELTTAQKEQARANIGLDNINPYVSGFVSYADSQSLTTEQKNTALTNLGIGSIHDDVDGTVKYNGAQILTENQKLQARANIGLDNIDSLVVGNVKYSEAQALTTAQQAQARANIGLSDIDSLTTGNVKYNSSQNLTEAQKTQARTNVGAASAADLTNLETAFNNYEPDFGAGGVVMFSQSQNLNDAQKGMARTNIGAASTGDISDINSTLTSLETTVSAAAGAVADVTKTSTGLTVSYIQGEDKSIPFVEGKDLHLSYDLSDNLLHLLDENDNEQGDAVFIAGGGGGGGAGGSAKIERVGDAALDVISGAQANLVFTLSVLDSNEDEIGGAAAARWYVNSVQVTTSSITHNTQTTFDIAKYLRTGANTVFVSATVQISPELTLTASKSWSVNLINLTFDWPYNDARINEASFNDFYTVYGSVSKVMHLNIDGVAQPNVTIDKSGTEMYTVIPMLSHGVHTLERWVTATINGVEVSTAHQYHEAIFVEDGDTEPIISIGMTNFSMNQYETVQIPIMVVDPRSLTTDARLLVNGTVVAPWSGIGRTIQTWNYQAVESGTFVLRVECISEEGGTVTVRKYREITATVAAVQLNVEEDTDYLFKFKASDFATNDAVRSWTSKGITATFSQNFDWINGGLKAEVVDGNIQQALLIKAGTRMTINHKLFAVEPMNSTTGMCMKVAFRIENVRDYDAEWLSCYSGGRGIKMSAHNAIVQSTGSLMTTPYAESSYIEYEAECYRRDTSNDGVSDESLLVPEKNYLMAWIDGVPSNIKKYLANEQMSHPNGAQEYLTIGSDDCDVWLYLVKFYQKSISMQGHVDNFIMDAPNSTEMIARYTRNDILDSTTQEIDYEKLANRNPDLRIYLYDIPYLTMNKIKKDPVPNCHFQQIWRNGPAYYQLTGTCIMGIQGTSSFNYRYGAANTDSKFIELHDGNGNDLLANGIQNDKSPYGNNWFLSDGNGSIAIFEPEQGEVLGPECIPIERDNSGNVTQYIKALGYKINDNSTPISYSNIKVNYASCEQVNNYCNAMWYQKFQPYPSLSPRDCMEFSMGVQFIKDSGEVDSDHIVLFGDDQYHMYSIANMGTSKNNVHVFHDLGNPNECCVEIKYNGKPFCDMTAFDANLSDWDTNDYFEFRYQPPGVSEATLDTAWKRVWRWMYENNPMAATNQPLQASETYGEYTFRGHGRAVPSGQTDTAYAQVLRGTKVKEFAGTYTQDTYRRRMAKMLSECEDYLVMDSFVYHFCYLERHTMVDNVAKNNFWSTDDLVHWDLSKAYDMDTSDGNNNEGVMSFDYGNEYLDADENDKKIFNSTDSVWWNFIGGLREACQTMFLNREAVGAWNAVAYNNFLKAEQKKVPERCWVQTYWYDYIRTYEQKITGVENMLAYLDGGMKTHQRTHYETFQEIFMSGKYNGSAASSRYIRLRGYTPAAGSATRSAVPPNPAVTLKMYNRFYAAVDVDGTVFRRRFEKGEIATIDFSTSTLNDTVIKIYPAGMIQEIGNLAALYGGDYAFGDAKRLRSLTLGSSITGYSNTNFFDLSLSGNPMLEYLYVQNLKNGTNHIVGNLDLTNCPALIEVDATGSDFTGVSFAPGGVLTTATLKKPTALSMINLANLTDQGLTIANYSGITGLRVENTPGVDVRTILNNIPTSPTDPLNVVRLVGMEWGYEDGGTTSANLVRLYNKQGRNETGDIIGRSVLSGEGYVPTANATQISEYETAWPDFNLEVGTIVPQFRVTYVDLNDFTGVQTTLYETWVDSGSPAPDIVSLGYINTPTRDPDEQYSYTYSGWGTMNSSDEIVAGLPQQVLYNTTIYVMFSTTLRSYTCRFYIAPGVPYGEPQTGLHYGDSATVPEDPTWTSDESRGIYRVFMGWDKSSGFIRSDLNVYATWDTAYLPTVGQKESYELTPAEFYAINTAVPVNEIDDYFSQKDYIEVETGRKFNYSNVQRTVIVGKASENPLFEGPLVFDGTANSVKEVDITPFADPTANWTVAIEYEMLPDSPANGTLVSLGYGSNGAVGARVRKNGASSNNTIVEWGNTTEVLSVHNWRSIVVLRHRADRGTSLYVYGHNKGYYSSNTGGQSGFGYNYDANAVNPWGVGIQKVRNTDAASDGKIILGATAANDGYMVNTIAKGRIYSMEFYSDDLGATDAAAMAAWPRETWRFCYYGAGKMPLQNESAQLAKSSWLMDGLLDRCFRHSGGLSSYSNTGGWPTSYIRRFLNEAVIKALPEWLINTIKPVTAYSLGGYNDPSLTFGNDRLYAITYSNIYSSAGANYKQEDSYVIPWLGGTNPNYKYNARWLGLQGIDTENCFRTDTDPTLLDGSDVQLFSVWYNTSQAAFYVYLTADYVNKYYSPLNSNTVGYKAADITASDGGTWFSAISWALRTPSHTTQSYYYDVLKNGSITSDGMYYYQGICFAFSA